ncbi:MFS transporter [Celerinatantimonas diazotrophica]|uniref:GPH family glycoside/pentoside/hexuronide:cation symporter n=1 Tax=Celerinatantimonas diazotrophica TaxID=412034 RepID=A0A4R1K265_9GAMM|nr:MFS transporter [Celerinatantimonas diazotrophica]TCK58095.1 GPH family glycoside/pentoside/hexuronide:cation symporter [Celerinatantimonas diazotrophica]CAG9297833.1 putative symporter YjmB [Celerinatantimonas diazotrophica]
MSTSVEIQQEIEIDEYHQLSLWERMSYGFGDFANNLTFGTVGGFLALYMTTVNAVGTLTAGFIFLFVRIVNVFWDPAVGTFVDKRTSKAGKYRPWILRAGVPLMIFSLLMFAPLPFTKANVPFAFITYLLMDLIYSVVNIPYGSLNASLTRDPESVDKLTTTRMMLANMANLLVYTLFPMFVQMASPKDKHLQDTGFFGLKLNLGTYTDPSAQHAWFSVYLIYAILGGIAFFLCYYFTKERVVATKEQSAQVRTMDLFSELRHNRPLLILGLFFMLSFTFMFFMNTVNGYFNQYVVGKSNWMGAIGLIASIPGIVFPVFWPMLKRFFGKKGFFHFFLGMFIVGELLTWAWSLDGMHDALWLAYLSTFLKQWGLTSATGFMWALVPEVVSYGELQSGKRNAGIINALMGIFFKIGFTLGGAIPLWFLAAYGFNEHSTTQHADAIFGINVTAIWIPIILAFISMIIMHIYPISDADIKDINKKLDAKRAHIKAEEATL